MTRCKMNSDSVEWQMARTRPARGGTRALPPRTLRVPRPARRPVARPTRSRRAAMSQSGSGAPRPAPNRRRDPPRTAARRPPAHPAHPRDARAARPQHLGARARHPDAGGPGGPGGVPSNTIPGFTDAVAAADDGGARLLAGPARRLLHPPRGRHLAGPRGGAHRARAPDARRHGCPHRQDPLHGRVRPLQRDLRVPRGIGGPGGGAHRGRPRQPPGAPEDRPDFDFAALERLIRVAERSAFGPSTQAIIDEAVSRDIP